jgi:hypothetical protein
MTLRALIVAGLAAVLAAGPATAADTAKPNPRDESPKQLLDEAGEKFMRAIELMLMAIPQYEAPQVLENGDIVIRRKRPEEPKRQDPTPPPAPPPPAKDKLDRT